MVEAFQRSAQPDQTGNNLTPREQEIVHLLAKGFLYKEIAEQLSLSVETVRTHLHRIYDKLHVHTRTEAVMKLYGKELRP